MELTYEQVKPLVEKWLEENGPKEKRVFIGGNYRNIALLRCIKRIVEDFMFVPVMPIELTETSKPKYEQFIHDIRMEILGECSFAISERAGAQNSISFNPFTTNSVISDIQVLIN
jgi:hypothetical protein